MANQTHVKRAKMNDVLQQTNKVFLSVEDEKEPIQAELAAAEAAVDELVIDVKSLQRTIKILEGYQMKTEDVKMVLHSTTTTLKSKETDAIRLKEHIKKLNKKMHDQINEIRVTFDE